jgi:hypothetical protein
MYKLKNFLFGYDYVYCKSTLNISKVRTLPDGTVYFYDYPFIKSIQVIDNPNNVLWLTCLPSKYFKDVVK